MSGLPGDRHPVPEGATCDQHPDRAAVVNVQGETDSFGFETILMCQECRDKDREEEKAAQSEIGRCDWCEKDAPGLRWARSYDEGLHGPTYLVCADCKKRQDDRLRREMEEWEDRYDYDDHLPTVPAITGGGHG